MTKSLHAKMIAFAIALMPLRYASAQATLPDNFEVAKPTIPDKTFKITDFGAVGDGKTLNTKALHDVIDACAKAGGGTVEVPAGRFLTGPFALTSNLNLHFDDGATIAFSDDRHEFKLIQGGNESGYENCLVANDCHDLALTGKGTIDGQGQSWWKEFKAYKKAMGFGAAEDSNAAEPAPTQPATTGPVAAPPHRPYMMVLVNCTRVLVQDVTLTNSPMFHFVPRLCRDVTIDSITIKSPAKAPNTDGIDPSGWNYHIFGCTIDTGDDDIALKPRPVPDANHLSCENFLIEHMTFLHGHGMSIGGGSNGGVRNMIVRDCTFDGTDNGVRLKSGRDRGGLVEYLTYENLTMKNVKNSILIDSYYPTIPKDPAADTLHAITAKTPIWRHIRMNNITSDDSDSAIRILGLPEMPIQDVELSNIRINAKTGIQITSSNGIQFENCQVSSTNETPATTQASEPTH
jgi:polygalacturonase